LDTDWGAEKFGEFGDLGLQLVICCAGLPFYCEESNQINN